MLAKDPSKGLDGQKLALLAVAGLITGLTACTPTQVNEVVVAPPPPVNTVAEAAAPEDTAAPEDQAAPPKARPKKRPKGYTEVAMGGANHCCKGKNDCKAWGGCKSDYNECKGKNDCKGRGGCKTAPCDVNLDDDEGAPPPRGKTQAVAVPQASPSGSKMCCKGQNDCKGKGMCKTDQHNCKGLNNCKSLGGCRGPC